jgi:hypothetical protein
MQEVGFGVFVLCVLSDFVINCESLISMTKLTKILIERIK